MGAGLLFKMLRGKEKWLTEHVHYKLPKCSPTRCYFLPRQPRREKAVTDKRQDLIRKMYCN